MTREALIQIRSLIDGVISGNIDPDDAIAAWPAGDIRLYPQLLRASERLYHYAIDSDIRTKDSGYAESLADQLKSSRDEISALIEEDKEGQSD